MCETNPKKNRQELFVVPLLELAYEKDQIPTTKLAIPYLCTRICQLCHIKPYQWSIPEGSYGTNYTKFLERSPRDWETTMQQNVVLAFFHTQNICHGAWKILRTTLCCFVFLQSWGEGLKSKENYRTRGKTTIWGKRF